MTVPLRKQSAAVPPTGRGPTRVATARAAPRPPASSTSITSRSAAPRSTVPSSTVRTAVPARPATGRAGTARPAPRPARGTAPRAPFVLLVLTLLGGGLVLLLLLNAASAADSFRQRTLQDQLSALNLQEQQLQRQVASLQAPQMLAQAARKLGLVPSGDPGFIVLQPDGSYRVLGTPTPAASPAPAPTAGPTTGPAGASQRATPPAAQPSQPSQPNQPDESGGHR